MMALGVIGLAPVAMGGQALPSLDELARAPRIKLQEFKKAVDADAVLTVDVRDHESYLNGHIPGAISVPLETIAKRAPELKASSKPIVTYCA
jgi:rhodanese-related sulfurtransferase